MYLAIVKKIQLVYLKNLNLCSTFFFKVLGLVFHGLFFVLLPPKDIDLGLSHRNLNMSL